MSRIDEESRVPPVYAVWARLLLGVAALICRLPRRWLYALGRRLGDLARPRLSRRRAVVAVNLALCFPNRSEEARKELERRHFQALGVGVMETLAAWSGRDRHMLGRLELDTGFQECIESARTAGHGLLLLGTHFTVMELIGPVLHRLIPDLVCVYRDQSNPLANAMMRTGRAQGGGHHPGLQRPRLRAMLKALRQNRVLWYAVDQDLGPRHSVHAPFFGVPAATLRYAGQLAVRTHSPVCLIWYRRLADDSGYRISLKPLPLEGDPGRDAVRINAALEQAVLQAPEQYFWVHRRFKTRPAGDPPLYGSGS